MRWLLPLLALLALPACDQPECARGDYGTAECRVLAENHYARLTTSTGVELRFQRPDADSDDSWEALGLLREPEPGRVIARPAGLADFALSIDGRGAAELSLELRNVAPDTRLTVDGVEIDPPEPATLTRSLELQLGDEPVRVRGARDCPDAFRLLAAGDVQTNPLQFERIVEDFHAELDRGIDAGEPVLGFLMLGDLSEHGEVDELDRIAELLDRSPIPVAVTPGNHDVAGDDYALFNRRFGPGNHAFAVCDARVVLLDSGDAGLAASVEARLPELLDPAGFDHLVVGTHYPAWAERTGTSFRDGQQGARFLAELARSGADRLVTGHIHDWQEHRDIPVGDATVHQLVSGTLGGDQGLGVAHYGVTRLRFDDTVDSCFHEVRAPGAPADGEEDPGAVPCDDGELR